MNKYRCSLCHEIYERDSEKRWIRSFCESEGDFGRLILTSRIISDKLRWYSVQTGYDGIVIGATSHSEAKLAYNKAYGMVDDWEALSTWTVQVVKEKLDADPKYTGDMYWDCLELLKKGVYSSAWTQEGCVNCSEGCDEGNPQYYDHDLNKFYCRMCKDSYKNF